MDKLFFEEPTQGWFWDFNSEVYHPGIGFGAYIICGCCGGVYECSDVVEMATEDGKTPFFAYDVWADLGKEIHGGEYPDDMTDDAIANSSMC